MRELKSVWKRRNVRTGKIEYIGAYKYYTSLGPKGDKAIITKSTFDIFNKEHPKDSSKHNRMVEAV